MRDIFLVAAGFIAGVGCMLGIAVLIAPKQEHLLDMWEEMNK